MKVDLRLAIPACLAWVACAIVVAWPSVPVAIALWAAAGILTVVSLRHRVVALGATALVAAALCCTSIAVHAPLRQPEVPSGAVDVVATTTETVRPGADSFEATMHSVDGRVVSSPVLVVGESPSERVAIGSTLEFTARLSPAEPGDDIAFLAFPDASPVLAAPPPWFLSWGDTLRERFLAASTSLPGAGGDLLAGLAIGDTSEVDESLASAMKTSSLTHLTAVSGANCAIVIGLIMSAGAVLGLRRGLRIAASLVVLAAFVVLVTPEPSVLRAAVMAALVLVALGMGRPVRGLPLLSLAMIALLVVDPWLSRNYGFVLSVLATAGLLLLANPLARVLERWMPRPIALGIAIPLAAQLACQPVIILLNASLPTYGVVANILAAPAAPLATVVGLVACVVLALSPPLGHVLCQLAWVPAAWIAAVARFCAELPLAQLPWPGEFAGVVLLVAVSSLGVYAALSRRRWARWGIAATVIIYVSVAGTSYLLTQWGRPDWQIAACDVGQGDAVVVRSAGQIALIDTGRQPALLAACLRELGIGRIDVLVLTHYDLDHVGGVRAVYGRVDTVFVGPSGEAADDRMVAELAAAGATVEQVSRGRGGLLGELRWQVLWPPERLAGIEPGNEASVTVDFRPTGQCVAGCLSSVFLGDLGEDAQNRVLSANPRLAGVDVVKVSHHGSADQSPHMYERLDATVGVIGVGADNGYGHPTDELLEILARQETTPLRTDQHGLILIAPGTTAGSVTVWTER